MELTPRHELILKTLIEEFLSDKKPVGSKFLCEKYDIGLSPATIRNVFRDLEENGYIASPHHSAGRIPTEKGYKFYVDRLITLYELSLNDKQKIQEEFLKNDCKLDKILNVTCKILSNLSRTASVVLPPLKELELVKRIELIHIGGDEILLIVITRSGVILNRRLFLDDHVPQESLYQISKFLNHHLVGFELEEVKKDIMLTLKEDREGPEDFLRVADTLIATISNDPTDEDIYIDGLQNLYNYYKHSDMDKLEPILTLLDNKELLREIFSQYIQYDGVSTFIGELKGDCLSGVSIIVSNYKNGDKSIGSMGVIGPQRLNYPKALSVVDFTSKLVSEMITKMSR
ncbi:MAG: heat-inducible transcription repressor HrcA [Leptospiraceae bacterium]|nr:heat-inducible transcription repressor HrcA [Leptospiraceae bacterium]MCP5494160.1 heat-inducible transcription repressor HrcA [Leptospiraceae bacterium]